MEPVTKLYRVVVEGFDDGKAEIRKLSAEFEALKKKKQELDRELAKTTSPAQVASLNREVQATVSLEADLTKQITEKNKQLQLSQTLNETNGAEGVGTAIVAYQNLIKQYKEAMTNSELMEIQFGKESAEAIEAARTAALYEAELVKINKLRGAPIPTPQNIPFTTNLDELAAEQAALKSTSTVVSEFDLKQAEAAISAQEFGQSQRTAAGEVKSTVPAFEAVIGSLDQYTGSLRDNIKAQIENNQALAANKAAQKEINEAIKASGAATEEQINQLAVLKEESTIIDQTNKQLTTTIRNQAREFIAANGAIEEGRAKVNLLQQAYGNLSEAERAQPFGQSIKNEIDILEPKVKELEGTIGLFQRNVGNYPSNFTGAFKVLETEVDVLKAKLASGTFDTKEFDNLAKKTTILNAVTKDLNTTFKTTTAEQTAYKEAARVLATEFGTESALFQNFSKEVSASNTKLKETDVTLNAVSTTGKKAGNVFQTIFSGLRNIANIIPGLGIQGLILLLLVPFEALASKIAEFASNVSFAAKSTEDLKKKTEEMTVAVHESQKEFVDAVSAVESLKINIQLAKDGFLKKDEVLKQYNDTLGKTFGQVKNLDQAEQVLTKNGDAYIQMMLLKAAANQALEAAAKKAFEAEEIRRKTPEQARTLTDQIEDILGSVGAGAGAGRTAQVAEQNRRLTEQKNRESQQRQIKDLQDAGKRQIDIAKDFQKQAADIAKATGADLLGGIDTKKIREHADRLNVEEQNALKVIDATYKTELSIENQRVTDIEQVHQLTFDEEITHAKRVEGITVNMLNSKISLLSKQKSLNAEELSQLAQFKEQRSAIELQTSEKIQEIEKKRFADQNTAIQNDINQIVTNAKTINQKIQDSASTSNVDKARASLEFMDTEIDAYQFYYDRLLELNGNYNKEELKKVKAHLLDLQNERNRGLGGDIEAQIKDIQARGDRSVTETNVEYQKQRAAILSNEKLTFDQKNSFIEKLTSANNITILSKELETINEQLKLKFQLLLINRLSEEDYEKARLAAVAKNAELQNAIALAASKKTKIIITDLKSFAANTLIKLFNFDADTDIARNKAKLLEQTLSAAYDTARTAMNDFYNSEAAQVERSRKNNEKRLQIEFDQLKARSQSQAETEALDKQFQARKEANDRDAFEKNKKIQREQAKINLAIQLSNLAVIAFSPGPLNMLTLGVAGTIMYAIQAALALANYALNVSRINSATFEQGGQVVPKRGGKFGGKTHREGGAPFRFRDESFEAEVDELAVIRTRNSSRHKKYQLTGTHTQIASALNQLGGGVQFAPGAKIKVFETGGVLGASLQAPVFTPSSSNSPAQAQSDREMLEELKLLRLDQQRSAAEISNWQRSFEVYQVTSTVTKAQAKQAKQKAIGTL